MASRYDDELWELVPAEPGPPPAHLAAFVRGLRRVERALDVGCGDGRLTAELDAAEVTAADVSAVALERAASRLADARLVELEPDATFPLDDAAFDLVLCAETIEHVRDVQLFLSEIRRVLRPAGELALTTPAARFLERPEEPLSPHLRRFTRRSLGRVLRELGFELRSLERRAGTLLARATRQKARPMRIVVTGAAGFIGSHLCGELVARGHEVVGIDAFTRFYARELKERNVAGLRRLPAFSLWERNLLDATGLSHALRGADAVCHLAGRPGVRGGAPVVFDAGNVRTTEAVMHAAAWAGVRRVVLASSSSVYGAADGPVREDARLRPLSPYGRSKRRAEVTARRLARRHRLELVTLRYFTVYGPRQRPDMAFARFVRAAHDGGEMPLLGDGRQLRDFTYVGDAVEATALALELGRPGAVYNVAGGRPASVAEALGLLGAALGRAPALAPRLADPREPRATAADLERARTELGWEPRTSLQVGLRRQVEHAAEAAALGAAGA